jgi:hypothetical protein
VKFIIISLPNIVAPPGQLFYTKQGRKHKGDAMHMHAHPTEKLVLEIYRLT